MVLTKDILSKTQPKSTTGSNTFSTGILNTLFSTRARRLATYALICIPTRLTLGLLAAWSIILCAAAYLNRPQDMGILSGIGEKNHHFLHFLPIILSIGFILGGFGFFRQWITRNRVDKNQFRRPIWWQPLRPIHGLTHILIGLTIFMGTYQNTQIHKAIPASATQTRQMRSSAWFYSKAVMGMVILDVLIGLIARPFLLK